MLCNDLSIQTQHSNCVVISVSGGTEGYPYDMRLGQVTLTLPLEFHYCNIILDFDLGYMRFNAKTSNQFSILQCILSKNRHTKTCLYRNSLSEVYSNSQ